MIKILCILVATVLGAILYRMGGASGYNTKFRDMGIPTVGILLLYVLNGFSGHSILYHIGMFLTFGCMFGANTTYFKKKGTDAKWWNWALVGLANGIALLPYAIICQAYMPFIVRTVALIIMITIWSEFEDNVVWEEGGRGALIIYSLGLFIQ